MKMILLCFLTAMCSSTQRTIDPPKYLLGNFVDDYGIEYSISSSKWIQDPGITLDILEIDSVEMSILGYNPLDSTFTKIDYMQFQNQGNFKWGYCYTTYDKKDKEDVISQEPANRDTPKTGCNGFPFSRMKSVNGF